MLRTPSSPISNDGLDFDFFDGAGPRITDTGVSSSSSSSSSSFQTNIGAAATTATSNTQAESTMIGQEDRDGRDEGFDYAVSVHGTQIRLAKDPMVGTGGLLWPAGQVLATYLSTRLAADPALFQGKRVLELGSGTGVVGLCLAMRLPPTDSSAEEEDKGTTVTLTDLAKVLPVLARNVALNGSPPAVRVRELSWCDPVSPDLQRAGDVVLLADCIYLESLFQPLVDTLLAVMSESSGAVAYLCYKKRRRADARFFVLLRKRFAVQTITLDDKVGGRGGMQSDGGSGIHLYAVTRK